MKEDGSTSSSSQTLLISKFEFDKIASQAVVREEKSGTCKAPVPPCMQHKHMVYLLRIATDQATALLFLQVAFVLCDRSRSTSGTHTTH